MKTEMKEALSARRSALYLRGWGSYVQCCVSEGKQVEFLHGPATVSDEFVVSWSSLVVMSIRSHWIPGRRQRAWSRKSGYLATHRLVGCVDQMDNSDSSVERGVFRRVCVFTYSPVPRVPVAVYGRLLWRISPFLFDVGSGRSAHPDRSRID